MHVVVCVKQVPDFTQVRIDPLADALHGEELPAVMNPYDVYAVEYAMHLKEHCGAGVTLLSMGPPAAENILRRRLSRGADHAVLLTDPAFAGADSTATSYTLAAAIYRLHVRQPVSLVICGKQSSDNGGGQTGPGIARHLGWPQLTGIHEIAGMDAERRIIVVDRKHPRGIERLRSRLPAVITVTEEIAETRGATLPNLIRSLRHELEIWSLSDLELDREGVGAQGSPTRVQRIFAPPPRRGEAPAVVDDIGLHAAVGSVVQVMCEQGLV